MSLRSVPATSLDNVRPGSTPCLGVGGTITDSKQYEQSEVSLNETLEIVFLGSPPFNLTSTICNNNGTCWCGTQSQNLSVNTYTWTVSSVNVTASNSPDEKEAFTTPGHSMIWAAVELNNISLTQAQYSYSPNFSLSSSSLDDQPSGATSPRLNQGSLGLVTLGVLSLAVFGVFAGI